MSRVYIVLTLIATLLVSVTGAYFSVTGLAKLFSGATISVLIMAGSLEFSKFIVVGLLYRYWGHFHQPLRVYLIFAVGTLMVITSIGIYGHLSNAYEVSAFKYHTAVQEIQNLTSQKDRLAVQIDEMQSFVDKIPSSRISRKFEFQKTYEPKVNQLRTQVEEIIETINSKKAELLTTQTEIGPAAFLAKAFHTDPDQVVKYLILIFVSVFDPLAVSLVFALNLLIRLREKYRGDEYKIGARSLTSPVDHRYKKSA